MKQGITVAFLTYLEADNLRHCFPAVKAAAEALGDPVEYLVVDTETPLDDTPEVCREYGIRYVNQEQPHYGGAIRMAFCCASMDKLYIFDADGSVDPSAMRPMYDAMQSGADLVIGSRYVEGGANVGTSSAMWMSRICNVCYRFGLGMKVRDCSTSYRLYRTQDVQALVLTGENFDVLEEILLKLRLSKGKGFTVREVPHRGLERRSGNSKRSLLKFIYSLGRTLLKMMILRVLARKGYKPEKHERQAEWLTKAVIAGGVLLAAAFVCALILNLLK